MLDLFNLDALTQPVALYTMKGFTKERKPFGILTENEKGRKVLRVGQIFNIPTKSKTVIV